jgi:hypothetical protein
MKPMGLLFAICFLMPALAQAQVVGPATAMIPPRFDFEAEPPDPPVRFAEGARVFDFSLFVGGGIMVHRFLRDDSKHVFLGYDLLVESQRQADTYRVTIGELGMGPFDMFQDPNRGQPFNPAEWTKLPIPAYPAPRLVFTGNTISIDLGTVPDTGQKLVDYVTIQPRKAPILPRVMRPSAAAPEVSGTARDFSVDDAEMQLVRPRVNLNGAPQDTTTSRAMEDASGALIWFSLPNRGRYILSLAPRPELGFVKAGEIRGGAIAFTLGDDKFTLQSNTPITTGYAPYILYVLHDPDWEPTAQAQRGHFQTGSVSPGEIALLRRK